MNPGRFLVLVLLLSCAGHREMTGSAPNEAKPATARAEPGSDREARAVSRPAADPCRGLPLPADQHFVAEGLCARVVATKQGKLRDLEFLPNGDLIGVRASGEIMRYRDSNENGVFDADSPEITEWADLDSDNAHGCAFADGFLYCGSQDGVKRFRYEADALRGGKGEDVVVGRPGGGNHPKHPVKVYDGQLYVVSGSEGNAMDPMPETYDTNRSVLKRFPLASYNPGEPFRLNVPTSVTRSPIRGWNESSLSKSQRAVPGGVDAILITSASRSRRKQASGVQFRRRARIRSGCSSHPAAWPSKELRRVEPPRRRERQGMGIPRLGSLLRSRPRRVILASAAPWRFSLLR